MTTYFISYRYKTKYGTIDFSEEITGQHPVEWLVEMRKLYKDEQYNIIFWSEISDELTHLDGYLG